MKTKKEIKEYLNATNKIIKCDDLKDTIIIYHGDSSVFHLENAYFQDDKDILYIWTEHCGYFYFYKQDLLFWKKLEEYPLENWFEKEEWKKGKL